MFLIPLESCFQPLDECKYKIHSIIVQLFLSPEENLWILAAECSVAHVYQLVITNSGFLPFDAGHRERLRTLFPIQTQPTLQEL